MAKHHTVTIEATIKAANYKPETKYGPNIWLAFRATVVSEKWDNEARKYVDEEHFFDFTGQLYGKKAAALWEECCERQELAGLDSPKGLAIILHGPLTTWMPRDEAEKDRPREKMDMKPLIYEWPDGYFQWGIEPEARPAPVAEDLEPDW